MLYNSEKEKKTGKARLTWLSTELDEIVQKVKEKQGFNSDSAFIRYCIIRYLESLSILSSIAHKAISD